MLNHPSKIWGTLLACLFLVACHKVPTLDNALALKFLASAYASSVYTVNIVTNKILN